MKTIKKITFLLLGLMPMLAFSAAPSGGYQFSFADLPLYDLSGPQTITLTTSGGTLTLNLTLDHQPGGDIEGGGTFTFTGDSGSASGNVSVDGKLQETSQGRRKKSESNGNDGRIFTLIRAKLQDGTGDFGNGPTRVKGSANINAIFDPLTGEWVGTGNAKVTGKGLKNARVKKQEVALAVDPSMTGEWTLDLDIVPDGSALSGTGLITLVNGRTVPLILEGSHDDSSDESFISLIEDLADSEDDDGEDDDDEDLRILLRTQSEFMDLLGLDAKAFGQRARVGDVDEDDFDDDDDDDDDDDEDDD